MVSRSIHKMLWFDPMTRPNNLWRKRSAVVCGSGAGGACGKGAG
jgi:hypothetical protein